MGINRVSKRGKVHIEVRRRWPDGKTFRRYYPNMTLAKRMLLRIEESIVTSHWKELREDLSQGENETEDFTVQEFSEIYLEEYCQHYNRRPDFKEQALVAINSILGGVKLKDLQRKNIDQFVMRRSKEVAPATINRGLAVLSNMINFAVQREYLKVNPVTGVRKLPEEKLPLRLMTLEEERQLVISVSECNPVIGAYVAVLGETGLRKSEGLRMEWSHVDGQKRMLLVPKTKTGEPRHVPLSDYALGWLGFIPRYPDSPWVFALAANKPLKDPKESFKKGKEKARLHWVRGLHDLRHFRATQWLLHGVDIQTVKYYLGHKRIETTQRYLHFVPGHAENAVRAAQEAEAKAMSGRHLGDTHGVESGVQLM